MSKSVRITYCLSHPIQYFSPMFKRMAEDFDLTVLYYSDVSVRGGMDKGFGRQIQWDVPLLEGYQYKFVPNLSGSPSMDNRFGDAINPGLWKAIRKTKAEIVVVNGWTYCSNWLAIFSARLMGKQLWIRAESPLNQELRKSKKVLFLKKWFLGKFLFRLLANKLLYIGKESKDFFKYYGVKEEKLVFTPYSIDNEAFRARIPSGVTSAALLEQLNLPPKKTILFSGKFIEKKRPLDLLKAFALLKGRGYSLVMVGDGELNKQMTDYIRDQQLEEVRLTGFINQADIPLYYKAASVFVMCSGMGETWGLSVNEAMALGKPVIVSQTCGCHADLVENEVNGFTYPEGDIQLLAFYIDRILSDDNLMDKMGEASWKKVQQYSIDAIVNNLLTETAKAS